MTDFGTENVSPHSKDVWFLDHFEACRNIFGCSPPAEGGPLILETCPYVGCPSIWGWVGSRWYSCKMGFERLMLKLRDIFEKAIFASSIFEFCLNSTVSELVGKKMIGVRVFYLRFISGLPKYCLFGP